ncbi:uncharacterized protein BJ212DRAFT_1274492, partial [Suillus subaureus]
RAFSGGHLQVNRRQHGISSQTFKAHVAVGSWSLQVISTIPNNVQFVTLG